MVVLSTLREGFESESSNNDDDDDDDDNDSASGSIITMDSVGSSK